MMDATALRREDGLGLGVAVVLHLLLVAALLTQAPDRLKIGSSGTMTVTIGDGDSEAGSAPALGVPDAPDVAQEPVVQDELVMEPEPQPQPTQKARPDAKPKPQPSSKPKPKPAQKQATSKQTTPKTPPKGQTDGQKGGNGKSKFDKEMEGIGESSGSTAEVQAEIQFNLRGKVAPFWSKCRISGLDTEKLKAVVSFRLEKSGRVSSLGQPRVTGQTASNAAQVSVFGECAQRAIKLAAPFTDLPADHYELWRENELTFTATVR